MSSEYQNGNAAGNGVQMEQSLRASELSYRRLFEAARDGIMILDVDTGRIDDVNPFLVELLGYSHAEMIGKTVGDLSPFKDIASNHVMLERLQKDGYIRYENLPLETRDGRHIAVEFVSNVYQAGDKKVIQCNIRDVTKAKESEAALRTSEAKFRLLADAIPQIVWITRPDGWNTYFNQQWVDYTGLTMEESHGHGWNKPFHPDDRQKAWDAWQAATTTLAEYSLECRLRRADGEYRWWLIRGMPQLDAGNNILKWIGTCTDIHESKLAEEAIRRSREEFKDLFDNAPVGFHEIDGEGRIVRINNTELKLLGYTAGELLGQFVWKISADEEESRKAALAKLAGDLVPQSEGFERLFRRKDGSTIPVWINDLILKREDGVITGIRATIQDMTNRKRAEEELREEQTLFRDLADTIPDTIYFKDRQCRFIRINGALAQKFGLRSAAEAVGKTDYDFQGKEHARQAYEDEQQIMHTGEPLIGREEKETWPDGRVTWVSSTKVALRDTKGNITGLVGISRDITERKKLEQQFRQSQKMEAVGQLASGVAHDFNNILAVIQMQADLLKTENTLSAQQLDFTRGITDAVQHASNLTRQLLMFSRRQTLQPAELDLSETINNMTNILRRTLGEQVELRFKFSLQPLFIHADAGMLDQVLLNLAVNARDAMPGGGKIVIETTAVEFDEAAAAQSSQIRPGKFICLSVSDSGTGIAPENLSKIFDPFFTTKEVGKGTGLGLATVFGIVQEHKGWINVYSEPGQGTTFRIYLPRLGRTSDQKLVAPAMQPVGGGNETILLVEDKASLRDSVKIALTHLGYRVLEANNGVEALEVWKKHHIKVGLAKKVFNQQDGEIQLLFTDMVMPGGISGRQLGEQLLKENPKLKVIYASGYSAEVAGGDFPLKEGVNFLAKPFQARNLAQILRKRLDENSKPHSNASHDPAPAVHFII